MSKPDVNKRRLVICLECLSYDDLQKYHTPQVDSLDPHPATSAGCTTRASVPALLGGFLPWCEYEGCHHYEMRRRWPWPFFMTTYWEANRLWVYCPNGWVIELLESFLRDELREMIIDRAGIPDRTGEFRLMRDHFLKYEPNLEGYFAYFHIMETHRPYYPESEPYTETFSGKTELLYDEEFMARRKRKAVEEVDKLLRPLIDLEVDELVITSDHDEDHFNRRVFLATRVGE
jgi:hypothetical protein